jgi:periplasmic protein CpxP/Spy
MLKQKLLALSASVIALTAVSVAHPATAQSTTAPASTSTSAPASASTPKTSSTPTGVSDILKDLNLTPDQQRRVDEIQALAAVQIKGVLTPEQLAQLKVMADAGKGDAESFKALNLTDAQKTRLNEVKMDIGMQLFPVLNSEQQKKLLESVSSRAKSQ